MTTLKFDATPTPSEGISLDDISEDKMKAAWKDYESKPEYKKFNKHDYGDRASKTAHPMSGSGGPRRDQASASYFRQSYRFAGLGSDLS